MEALLVILGSVIGAVGSVVGNIWATNRAFKLTEGTASNAPGDGR